MTTQAAAAAAASTCALCDGSGWKPILQEAGAARRVIRCGCWTNRQRLAAFGVPSYFADAHLENFRARPGNTVAIAAAREWLEKDSGDLYLFGEVGVGKTRLACSLLNDRFTAGARTATFVRVPYLMLLQLQGIDDPAKKAEANGILDRCLEAEVLCLDDVAGAENASDFSRRVMVTLYDQRLDRGLRTIWTSNLSLRALAQFYGDDRLPSRIAGACGEVIEIGGDDFRTSGNRF